MKAKTTSTGLSLVLTAESPNDREFLAALTAATILGGRVTVERPDRLVVRMFQAAPSPELKREAK